MEAKHTPGPWEWDYSVSIKSGRELVALIYSTPHKNTSLDANARLIAAAPELLEALQKIARMDYGNPYASDCADVAREAILKATGKAA